MRKRLLSFVLAVLMIATLLPVTALAYTTYYINGVAVRCDDFDSSPNECWTYANNIYNKIWGQQFNSLFDDSANSLRNLSDSELTLTAEHLRNYVSNAALGSALRICNSEYLHGGDGWGHSQIIVQKDSNGFTVLQGGLSASPYRNERYYTWSEYLNSWNYAYIKYIKWPGAPAYGGGTVTPDPGLSVKETITCKRTIKLPERVVNLYSNPTDTTRLTYFDYGPTVYSSRYAVMSDGSIMYEVGATNHQGQDIKVWLKYESDMTVTKQHTYGSTQYESAHPHRGYKTCQCGDKFYTGETTSRSDCSECNGNVKYAVDGGYITFDKKTGTITACDSTVTKANIPQKIEGVAVKSIGESAFRGCEALTSVTIPNSVTNIGESAFYLCEALTSMTIPNSVTSIGERTFYLCEALTSVTIPNSVTNIGQRAFSGCKALTSITIPNSVTNIGKSAFSECKALTSVTIPDSVTSIREYTFFMCESLVNVTIPNGVTSIGEEAFSGCKSLTSVTIPDSVMNIDKYAFYDCESLTGIWVGKGNRYYSSDASGVLFSKDQTTLIQCPNTFKAYAIPNSVINIGRDAFAHCKSLTSVTIPDSVTSIGVGGFSYCDKLTDVYYTGAETAWNKIEISDYNEALKNATIHYNSASHEHSYTAVVTAPTCTSKGYTTHTCACGDSYVDTYVDALGHAWDSGKVTKQPTATETGIRTFTCTRCSETKTETIPKLTHEHSYMAVVTAPTCTAKGYTLNKCSRCGDEYRDAETAMLPHKYVDGVCTACGDKVTMFTIGAVTAKAGDTVTVPVEIKNNTGFAGFTLKITADANLTLTGIAKGELMEKANSGLFVDNVKGGVINWTSDRNITGDGVLLELTFTVADNAPDGKYEISVALKDDEASNCVDENGRALRAAFEAGSVLVSAAPHMHDYAVTVTAPTCTAKGYTTHTCACGDSYVDTYVDALGHAWDNGKVTKPATEAEDGVKTFTCTRCGETKTEVIPATGSVDVTEMFTDVSHSWADDGIQYCVTHQLMSGIGNDLFGPKLTTTRAQIVQILYNLEGEPKVSGTTPFTDLTQDWYQDAVLWAYQTGVVAGTSSTTFEPDRPVTREQIAVILMEYVTRVLKLERTWTPADLSTFPDADSVSDWAKDAMADAVALGLISGASNGGQTLLEPQGSATREQVATILMEFCKNVKK